MERAPVLVVDDKPENLFSFRKILTQAGFQVETASSGMAALRFLISNPVSLILLDVQMPEMNGFETARMVREKKEYKDLPIIFISATRNTDEFVKQGYAVGAYEYLSKPIDNDILINKVQLFHTLYCQQKALEERNRAVEKMNRALESNEVLQKALQVAESATQAKDEFLASMSHELRTPLTAILGCCDVLMEEVVDLEHRSYLKSIRTAGEGQLALVNDILDVSKVESGQFTIEELPYSLGALLHEVGSMLLVKAQDAGVQLTVQQKKPEPYQLLGDYNRIKQILINLVGNAIKFTEQGSVTVTTEVVGGSLRFNVVDTGIGIKAEYMGRLFQRFEQEDSSISRRFGGSGLGLFISHSLAELMGGELTASSEVGKGSTFTLQLPYQVTDVPVDSGTVSERRISLAGEISGSILLAEDTPELQLLFKSMLQKMGAQVDVAENGAVAVERVSEKLYDLVLMDMQMPVMDGVEATRRIRESDQTIPIVAMTANVMERHRLQFAEVGCSDFLEKPIDHGRLRAVLSEYLSRRAVLEMELVEPIVWDLQYSVGHPLMDQHHHAIIGCLNDLIECYQTIQQPASTQRALTVFSKLNEYTNLHLRSEERLLAQVGFADLDAHTLVHNGYQDLIASFYQRKMDASNLLEIISQLRGWWSDHILKQDMCYKPFVKGVTLDFDQPQSRIEALSSAAVEVDEELMGIFIESAAKYRTALAQGLAHQDWGKAKSAAHSLKGSAASFGFPRLTRQATLVCDAYDSGLSEQLPPLLEQLIAELDSAVP